jgi:hypothetical protein
VESGSIEQTSQVLFGGTATLSVPQNGDSQSQRGFEFQVPVPTEMGDVSTRPIRRAQRARTTDIPDPTHSALETDIDDEEPLQTQTPEQMHTPEQTPVQTRRLVRSRSIHM